MLACSSSAVWAADEQMAKTEFWVDMRPEMPWRSAATVTSKANIVRTLAMWGLFLASLNLR